jgi:hypothetical protein
MRQLALLKDQPKPERDEGMWQYCRDVWQRWKADEIAHGTWSAELEALYARR